MENDNDQRTNSHDDKQLVSETSLGRNSEKKVDAALGNQTETSTVKVSQLQNSRKGEISESSCDAGKRRHDLFFLLLPMRKCWGWLVGRGGRGCGVIVTTLKVGFSYRACYLTTSGILQC